MFATGVMACAHYHNARRSDDEPSEALAPLVRGHCFAARRGGGSACGRVAGQGRSLTRRFREVLEHYGMRSTRIRPGKGHENGVGEQAHYRLKFAITQALVLRSSRDFSDVGAYEQWVRGVVERSHNRHLTEAFGRERSSLHALPSTAVPNRTAGHHRPWRRGHRDPALRLGGQHQRPFPHLVAEGVFVTEPDGAVRFVPAGRPPTDLEVGRLLGPCAGGSCAWCAATASPWRGRPRRPRPPIAWCWRNRRWPRSPVRRRSAGWPPGRARAIWSCGSGPTPRRRW